MLQVADLTSFPDRFKLVLEKMRYSANEFGGQTGMNGSQVSKFIRGENYPGYKVMHKIAVRFPEINWDWLITGRGDMFVSADEGLKGYNETTPQAKGVAEPKPALNKKQEQEWRKKVDHKLKQHDLMLEILAKPMAKTVAKELMDRAVASYNEKK